MNKTEFKQKWKDTLELLSSESVLGQVRTNTYFSSLIPYKVSEKENQLIFITPTGSPVFRSMVSKYQEKWQPVINDVFGKSYNIQVLSEAPAAEEEPESIIQEDEDKYFNPAYTFSNFVTGPNNMVALAASLAVAEDYSSQYNPLFIYGGSGLGKTHLMHAIAQYVLQNHPKKKVVYVSSEMFTNEFVISLQKQTMDKFRSKYRKVDYFLFDDVQFIAGKDRTEEELFHTFEELFSANKQIVFASDCAPGELGGIPERLKSRFAGGMTVDIKPPEYETRIAILKNRAVMNDLEIDDDMMSVLEMIAQNVQNNIRELEGAFNRVVTHAAFTNEKITPDFAKRVLTEVFANSKPELTPDVIKNTVAKYYGIKTSDLVSPKRSRNIAYPRQIAIYLIRKHTDSSYPDIGEYFGGRDHSTIMHSYVKIEEELKMSQDLKNTIANIEKQLDI